MSNNNVAVNNRMEQIRTSAAKREIVISEEELKQLTQFELQDLFYCAVFKNVNHPYHFKIPSPSLSVDNAFSEKNLINNNSK